MNIVASVRAAIVKWADRIVRRSRIDTRRAYAITQERIAAALNTLSSNGYHKDIADINDTLTRDPHIRGVLSQLRAGVAGIDIEPVAVSEDPRAQEMLDAINFAEERCSSRPVDNGVIAGWLRGAALTEVLYEEPPRDENGFPLPVPHGTVQYWRGFSVVPQQRLRHDMNDGESCGELMLIVDPLSPNNSSIRVRDLPAGKFIRCQVDEDIPDFALRGLFQSILDEWNDRRNVRGWEMQAVERYGMPIPVGKASTQTGRDAMREMMADFGASGMLIIDDLDAIDWGPNTTKELIHEVFLEKSAERISVAILGATQTATIAQDAGSKASVGEHQNVRRDILYAIVQLIAECKRRDLWVPFVRRNFGEAMVPFTPRAKPQFDEPIDLLTSAQAWGVLKNELGYIAPIEYVNEITGIDFTQGAPTPKVAPAFGPVPPSGFTPKGDIPALPPVAQFPAPKAVAAAAIVKVHTPETPPAFGRDVFTPLKRIVDSATSTADLEHKLKHAPIPGFEGSADLLAAEMLEQTMKAMQKARAARGNA